MRRLLIASLIATVIILSAVEVFVPRMVSRGASVALADLLGTGESRKIRLDSEPAMKMLLGEFNQITVEGRNVRIGQTIVDKLSTTVHGVAVNMKELLLRKRLRFWREGDRVISTFVLSEGELARRVWAGVDGLKEPTLRIHEGKAIVKGYLELNHRTFKIDAEGRFLVTEPDEVAFKVDELWVDDVQLPGAFRDKLMEVLGGPDLVFDFGNLPIPVRVSEVDMREGLLYIKLERRK